MHERILEDGNKVSTCNTHNGEKNVNLKFFINSQNGEFILKFNNFSFYFYFKLKK